MDAKQMSSITRKNPFDRQMGKPFLNDVLFNALTSKSVLSFAVPFLLVNLCFYCLLPRLDSESMEQDEDKDDFGIFEGT